MDKAYFYMGTAFSVCFFLGLVTSKTWIPAALSALVPAAAAIAFYEGPTLSTAASAGFAIWPFLIAATLWYALIGLAGAWLGRRVRIRQAAAGWLRPPFASTSTLN